MTNEARDNKSLGRDYTFKDWNTAKIIDYITQPRLTGLATDEDIKRYNNAMQDYAIYLSNKLFTFYESHSKR